MQTKKCPHCGSEFYHASEYCPYCKKNAEGNSLTKKCPHCGAEIYHTSKYCTYCKNEVSRSNSFLTVLLSLVIGVGITFLIISIDQCESDTSDYLYESSASTSSPSEESSSDSNSYDYCRNCQKTFLVSELVVREQSRGYFIRVCRDCAEKMWWREQVKEARNKWVDDNPVEARRRGITKF